MDEEQNSNLNQSSSILPGLPSKTERQQFLSHSAHYPMNVVNFAPLNGVNYKKWKEDIELMLGILDYDHVLREDPPAEPASNAAKEIVFKHQEWHKHNRIALIYIKRCITDAVKGGIPESDLAKVYLASIADKYKVSDKAETGYLMNKLIRMSFNGQGSIREYILQGIDTACKLKEMKVSINDSFLVHLLLNSLPEQYSHLRSLYNTQKVECYTDASYKQDHDDLKSTSGYIFMLAGGAISWKASKQSLTATSTFQAEYIAIYDATSHAIWLKNFIDGLKIIDSIQRPLTVYCDNAAAVFFAKNNKRSSGSRNIDVKYFAVREYVRDKEVEVLKIGTKEQLADPFTKALSVECFKRHTKDMGMRDLLNN